MIWLPEGYGREKTRRYVLWVVMVVALAIVSYRSLIQDIIFNATKSYLPEHIAKVIPETSPDHLMAAIILGAVVFVAYLVLYFSRDKTVMGRHPNDLNEEFPERDYKAKLNSFCEILRNHLRGLNTDSNWRGVIVLPR